MGLNFRPGVNIAMKIPTHEYTDALRFYKDVLGLKDISSGKKGETPRLQFGDKVLWLDCVATISQAEIWLEIVTNDIEAAAAHFKEQGYHRRDEIEPLPEGFKAFWLASPSNIIHLISSNDETGEKDSEYH